MKYDVIIVGAGASGMMAAITAASHHKKVLLLERMDKCLCDLLMKTCVFLDGVCI